jgi:hypothetical protein
MGLIVSEVANPVAVDEAADQPSAFGEALARIAAGAPWAYDTFYVYEALE